MGFVVATFFHTVRSITRFFTKQIKIFYKGVVWVALEHFQNPKFHKPSSKIEWTTAIWRYELQKVKVLKKWYCRTATAVPSATGVRISNGLFRMVCMIHKHLLMPWNHIQNFFPVPLLTDWLVEGHLNIKNSKTINNLCQCNALDVFESEFLLIYAERWKKICTLFYSL
jgi:hypothetical protein